MSDPTKESGSIEGRYGAADALREFLAASTAVWREIDRLSSKPDGYKGLASSTGLRKRERAAWERYREFLDAAAHRKEVCHQ